MKNLAIASALLLCLFFAFTGCGKDKNKDADNPAVTQETDDLDQSAVKVAAQPRSWEQSYEGEAVVDMPTPAASGGGGDVQDELSALLGEDSGGDSSATEDSVDMTVGGEATLPFELTLRSEDIASGEVTGEITWTSLQATNNVEGKVGPGHIAFEETSVITNGRDPGCRYELEPDPSRPKGWLKGSVDCSFGPGGQGTISMSIAALAETASSSDDDSGFNMNDLTDMEDTDSEDLETQDTDTGDDSSVDSSLDAMLGLGGSDSAVKEEKPKKQESDAGAALDALLSGGSATDNKPAPEKKKEEAAPPKDTSKKPPKAAPEKSAPPSSSGGDEDDVMNELLDMIDKTKVD